MRYTSPFEKFVLLTIALLAITATMYFTAPAWNPPKKDDTGVTKCEEMARNISSNKKLDVSVKMTTEQYEKNRDAFANSRYPDLQDAGTKFVESVRLMDKLTDEELGNGQGLDVLVAMKRHYDTLRVACSNHGVYVPQLV